MLYSIRLFLTEFVIPCHPITGFSIRGKQNLKEKRKEGCKCTATIEKAGYSSYDMMEWLLAVRVDFDTVLRKVSHIISPQICCTTRSNTWQFTLSGTQTTLLCWRRL